MRYCTVTLHSEESLFGLYVENALCMIYHRWCARFYINKWKLLQFLLLFWMELKMLVVGTISIQSHYLFTNGYPSLRSDSFPPPRPPLWQNRWNNSIVPKLLIFIMSCSIHQLTTLSLNLITFFTEWQLFCTPNTVHSPDAKRATAANRRMRILICLFCRKYWMSTEHKSYLCLYKYDVKCQSKRSTQKI